MFSQPIKINFDNIQNDYLKKASSIAQIFINTLSFKGFYFDRLTSDNAEINLKETKILFSNQSMHKKSKDIYFAWVERNQNTRQIFINSIFELKLNQSNAKEKDMILFFLGVCILHEFVHLCLRWKGQDYSPTVFKYKKNKPAEAGKFAEIHLFGSTINLVVPINSSFNENITILGKSFNNICCLFKKI